jgi:hypothetical protein
MDSVLAALFIMTIVAYFVFIDNEEFDSQNFND